MNKTNVARQAKTVSFLPPAQGLLQRKCACGNHTVAGGECTECAKEKQTLQRAPFSPGGKGIEGEGKIPPIVHDVLRSPGQPLDTATRAFFEPRLGHDFSQVRMHTDAQAAESARVLDARAYTVGSNIVFGPWQPSVNIKNSGRLLAHELTHVVQQRNATAATALQISQPGSFHENEAEHVAELIAGGAAPPSRSFGVAPPPVTPVSAPMLQRSLLGGVVGGLGGALAGGLLGLAIGGPIGGIIGLVLGGIVGAIIGHRLTRKERRFVHWETAAGDVPLIRDPGASAPETMAMLPAATRLIVLDTGERAAFNRQGGDWVLIRVTTGPHLNLQGWLRRAQIVERPETTEVSPETAAQLFNELAAERFLVEGGGEAPIPFHYPIDGCYARAHRMSDILTEKGYASERVFAVSRVPNSSGLGARSGLRVRTPFAGDVPAGQEPAVEWWYHVAPILRVRDPQLGLVQMVIDPSTTQGPVTIEQWTGLMRNEPFARMSLDDVQSLVNKHGEYPAGRNIVFTAPREQYYPPFAAKPDPEQGEEQAQDRRTLTGYARLAPVHELAANIRRMLTVSPVDAEAIIIAIRAASAGVRHGLWARFPHLRAQLHAAVSSADAGRIEAAIASP